MWGFKDSAIVYLDEELIGDSTTFISWAIQNYNFEDFRNEALYETLRKEAYASFITSTQVNQSICSHFNLSFKIFLIFPKRMILFTWISLVRRKNWEESFLK